MWKKIIMAFAFLSILLLAGCDKYDLEKDNCMVFKHYTITYSPNWEGDGYPMTGTQIDAIRAYGFEPSTIGVECVKWKEK